MFDWFLSLALIALGLLVIYQIRLLRRISEKLRNLSKPERDPRVIAKKTREENWQHYRQSEYFAQLINLMDFKAAIPGLRSWAASADVLFTPPVQDFNLLRVDQFDQVVAVGYAHACDVIAEDQTVK